jgi:hypothetical protein
MLLRADRLADDMAELGLIGDKGPIILQII